MNETITTAIDGFIPVATGLVPGSAAKVLTESVFIKDSVFSYIDENGDVVIGAKQNKINKIFNETLNSVATEDDIKNIFGDDWNAGSNLNYLSFTAVEDSTIKLVVGNINTFEIIEETPTVNLEYSMNGIDFQPWNYETQLSTGQTLYLRGDNPNGFSSYPIAYSFGASTGKFECHGNVMSLLYKDDFEGKLTIPRDYCFVGLFINLFAFLANNPEAFVLLTAPELPATTLANNCYQYMFSYCTSLTTAPELPATTLTVACYTDMFYGCTSLTTAPELPATTLTMDCYTDMFYGCTSLTTAPELPATKLVNECYQSMFSGCTSLTTAPELPATKLADECYQSMFSGCSKLNYIKMLATDISATDCLKGWATNVASMGTFIKHPNMTSLPTGSSGIPEGWTVQTVQDAA